MAALKQRPSSDEVAPFGLDHISARRRTRALPAVVIAVLTDTLRLIRNSFERRTMISKKVVRAVVVSALPLIATTVVAGGASAGTGSMTETRATPVAGLPLEDPQDVTTNPNAQYPDPVLNGAALGAGIGSAVGSATGSGGPILGGLIGALVGAMNPDVVPQVLP
ncbi:hypothetical protein IU448_16435 [Nocardia flavorosea]|uniref:glycine zipper domain-containing protein n=1 Tax=Nocardia flavorosea TaxID=53429 RepID=UPI0018939421|nr:glycine zipper domain-containing protein [Nocardia flavorosea]MBF6350590.1 hypothetical protein [Nocardia flavorosea]